MASLDCCPAELLKKITRHLPYEEDLEMRLLCRRLSKFGPPCRMTILRITNLNTSINLSANFGDQYSANKFNEAHYQAKNTSMRACPKTGKVTCTRSFAFPPACDYSFFEEATIHHLEMNKNFPIYLESGNIEHLTRLLAGCKIDKISLVVDLASSINFPALPAFLASLHVKHVEFVAWYFEDFSSQMGNIAGALAAAGVREVSFSKTHLMRGVAWVYDEETTRREQQFATQRPVLGRHNRQHPMICLSTDIVQRFFDAGFDNVSVNELVLLSHRQFIEQSLDHGFTSVDGVIGLEGRWERLHDGRYRRISFERGIVATKLPRSADYLFTIEINGPQAKQ